MIVALTGSTGFLGAHLVPLLIDQGHQVVALVRPGRVEQGADWLIGPGIRVVPVALDDRNALVVALSGCHTVVHALAALRGDEAAQRKTTVESTEVLLNAMAAAGIRRLVGISSLSVYGWGHLAEGDVLNESSPLETQLNERDTYARCKFEQDALFTAFGALPGRAAVVLRPGIFYGPRIGHADPAHGLWNFALGRALGTGSWLVMGPLEHCCEVPIVHVADVAAGVVAALSMLDQPNMGGAHVFNLIEDPAPSRSELVAALSEAGPVRNLRTLPWKAHLWMARGVSAIFRSLTGGVSGLPGLLSPSALWARYAPVHYDVALARSVLGWRPRYQAIRDFRARALAFTGPKV